jgi:uncharacterized protein (TIGR02466 family)
MSFDLCFPTAILNETIKDHEKINIELLSAIEDIRNTIPTGGVNWIGKPYNTCGTFDISKDDRFANIIKEVTANVHLMASRLGVNVSKNKFNCEEGWLNIYKQNDFQEYHLHAGFQFSAVYYVKTPTDSSQIIFESPNPPDMMPLPITFHGPLNDQRVRYPATAGQVIVFRSNLKHCVPSHQGTEERISLAFNFK